MDGTGVRMTTRMIERTKVRVPRRGFFFGGGPRRVGSEKVEKIERTDGRINAACPKTINDGAIGKTIAAGVRFVPIIYER